MDEKFWCNQYGCWNYDVKETTNDSYTCDENCKKCCMHEKEE